MKREVRLKINGIEYAATVPDRMLLVQFIRDVAGLKGTHIGCDTGHCGACTVLLGDVAVKSCLMLAVQANGEEITTVEGLSHEGKLSKLQESFRNNFALQCGYCTPGFLMLIQSLALRHIKLSENELKEALGGNICRCNNYLLIVRAAMEFLETQ